MRKLLMTAGAFVSVLWAAPVGAQSCLGQPSFSSGFVHINTVAEFPEGARAYAAAIGAGRPNELFGNVGGGIATYDGLDEKSTYGLLELGYQVPLGRAQLCPVAGLYLGSGPNDDEAGFKIATRGISAGAAAGLPVTLHRVLTLVPNAAVRYEYLSQNLELTGEESVTDTFNSGVLDIGLGLVFFDRVSIQPLMHFPFGGDDQSSSFALFASVSIGWRDR